ncbi:MAG: type II toxin-antitoxin system VapB family antitoxin [Gemmatimonadales bacterium]
MGSTSGRRPRSDSPRRGPGRPSKGWARTNIRVDRTKLEAARRILGLKTASETVDAALDAVTFRQEVLRGIDRMAAHTATSGGLVVDPDD